MLGEVLIRSGLDEDVDRALTAVGADTRIGHKYMRYGFGYGGPCLPRDNRAFAHYAQQVGLDFPLGTIVDEFNRDHTGFLVQNAIEKNKKSLPFYMASITYKPHTDIIEESQQHKFLVDLLDLGHHVFVEPSNLLPVSTVQHLLTTYTNLRFMSRQDLAAQGIDVFEIYT